MAGNLASGLRTLESDPHPIDRAIQVHGGAGVCDDFPLAMMYAHLRTLRLADGPDEIHKRTIARGELRRLAPEPVGQAQ